MNYKYCNNLFSYSRFSTREVNIGGVPLGGNNPIRLQSMTNTNSLDTTATVEQCIRIINAGADYVRITTPGTREAENLAEIKKELRKRSFDTPLVADVHFNPKVAEICAGIVEKVRINPGNYSDKKTGKINFSETEYKEELEKIHSKLIPLLKICKEHKTVLRIGVNHGSLSDRIMDRYGDTPLGMVESAMEFLRICESENFHDIVVSLKASNTRVMVMANRLLVNHMISENMNYPLHLGVTEAGEGEDGRIKSAVGIGTLLSDGIGDTIRISLTEDPEFEIPVARELVKYFANRTESEQIPNINLDFNSFEYHRRTSTAIRNIGGNNPPVVICDWDDFINKSLDTVPDYFYIKPETNLSELPKQYKYILNMHDWFKYAKNDKNIFPLLTDAQFNFYGEKHPDLNFVVASNFDEKEKLFENFESSKNTVLILETFNSNGVADQRSFLFQLLEKRINIPVVLNRNYSEDSLSTIQLKASSDLGTLITDGFCDGIWIRNAGKIKGNELISTSFGILQAGRARISKAEFISCPSCGRTIFDIQSLLADVKKRTSHLKNLKIAVMGCNVNGPGEMADADYGFVGAGHNTVTLYKAREIFKKNIPVASAIEELIQVIKDSGDWIEE
jgi:(E)-4-hydroxy-3-methylbut-2-enyl-diphosphate synthase